MQHVFGKNLNAAVIFLVATVSIEGVAGSNSYRWQNSSGETMFSDQPPPNGEKYEVINIPTSRQPMTSEAADDVPQETESSGSGEGDSKNNTQLCESAKKNLLVLEGPGNVSVHDEKGELHELSPEERIVMQQTAKAKIDVYCD